MPDMREEFEAWLLREHGLESEWQDERNCFKDYSAHLAFKAWQASRAALRVRPPKPYGSSSLDAYPELAEFNRGIRECLAALQKAGIEVK
ncbi:MULTISPECIES: hypothetical protein [Pseudomonas]|nr:MULTISPECIES: hypothetical protein [Pseudomonas]YP_009007091.1 Hypothetical protein CF86_gp24 [Pseudomonas phage vB_PaeP_Tr60_Ab31]YP_009275538.1 hypothetical protein BH779_gp51 [Pseudomonas phage JBD44]QVJ12488.1 hypothetical protein [Pseudomonas phage PSA04]UVD41303.1 hypothetical protein [Pseudomonas phage vB_Pae_HB2107-3I]AMD42712.1 hypothetical protein JBD44_51 [Pseudomonas phage JBD44]EIU5418170.1 hypothetical protein [Pseudomonas aeruginosa]EKU3993322.1 hypothetical protein [Pseudo